MTVDHAKYYASRKPIFAGLFDDMVMADDCTRVWVRRGSEKVVSLEQKIKGSWKVTQTIQL
jgi:hypothetical protein